MLLVTMQTQGLTLKAALMLKAVPKKGMPQAAENSPYGHGIRPLISRRWNWLRSSIKKIILISSWK